MDIVLFRRLPLNEVIVFLRNLAVILKAGIPLPKALTLLEQAAPKRSRAVVRYLRTTVESGRSLAEAMRSSPRTFPDLALHLITTGEASGTLEVNLIEVVKHLRKAQDLKRKIQSASLYPTFVLIAVTGLILAVGTFVLPKLIPLFESLDVTLPWTTRVLFVLARFFETHGVTFSLAVLGMIVAIFFVTRVEGVKPYAHRVLLGIPLLGKVLQKATVAQVSATLGTLLRSGVPLPSAIDATAAATGNRVYRGALARTRPLVESGRPLAEGLRSSGKLFPLMAVMLIEIGEQTGTLEETLEELAMHYESEVDYAVRDMTTALEPLLLIIIGIIVGFTVIAIITPIYEVTGRVG